jgi:hypothetical protein
MQCAVQTGGQGLLTNPDSKTGKPYEQASKLKGPQPQG